MAYGVDTPALARLHEQRHVVRRGAGCDDVRVDLTAHLSDGRRRSWLDRRVAAKDDDIVGQGGIRQVPMSL